MDCKTARMLLECSSLRPAELDVPEAAALDAHLQDCGDCQSFDQIEKHWDAEIARAMQSVPVPADLRDRISRQVTRRKWAFRRRGVLRVAAAAALLIGLSSGAYAWFNAHRPELDLEGFAYQTAQLRGDASPKRVEEWFLNSYGITTRVPRELNYRYLESCSVRELFGSSVPSLLFIKGSNIAEVLILDGRHLNFDAALRNPRTGSGGVTIELRADPDDPSRAYLVKYSGDALDWLMVENGQPAI